MIAAAGKPALLRRTLDSLAACIKPPEYAGTVVIENGPRCGIGDVVRSFPAEHRFESRYVEVGNKSHALNCALADIADGLVFFTDDDVRLDPQVLVAYARAARDVDRGRYFGGQVLIDAEHGLPPAWMRRYYSLTIAEPWRLPYEYTTPVPGQAFMGTNWAAFAGDLRDIGGFETRLGPGAVTNAAGQETEAQRRLMQNGAQGYYVPSAVAWHYLHREFLEPAWVLKRAYRHGLEWGIRRTRGGRAAWWQVARAALGRLNARLKGHALRLLGGEQRRFAADFHAAKWQGRWEGIWLGTKWDELPQVPATTRPSLAREPVAKESIAFSREQTCSRRFAGDRKASASR
jgi:GT2 family glycosyltransferase